MNSVQTKGYTKIFNWFRGEYMSDPKLFSHCTKQKFTYILPDKVLTENESYANN